ncbi:MAG: hypothetical protein BHV96_02705 [Clostridium sp. CAG:354_28_25]|nr:MAG: hypothetical protein BHV96_02705 [Clostridium sp. CAG:354_28_25]
MRIVKLYGKDLLLKELKHSLKYFIQESNENGLIRDKTVYSKNVASIAAVGYGLAALVISVERKIIKYEQGYERANRTLDTFLNNVEGKNGFFYHFVNMKNGKREWNSEISIIDTAIFICGALLVGEYFSGIIKTKAYKLFNNINWKWYVNPKTNYFYMGYKPEIGFWGNWDMYAEQLMMYVLGVASEIYPISKEMYYKFKRPKNDYKGIKDIIFSYGGSLFTYQYSHAWIDFKGKKDIEGVDWFENSRKATLANREYCINNMDKFKTFNKNSWGLTACVGPRGYSGGYGASPSFSNLDIENDGTVAPCGAIGSIVFTPNDSIKTLEYFYNNCSYLWGKYGLKDSYNLARTKRWVSKEYLGIDKGIEILMIENYLTGLVWKYMMKNKYIQSGLKILGITKNKNLKLLH